MWTSGSSSSRATCTLHENSSSVGSRSCLCSKRVEGQIKELEDKSDKKKMEVRGRRLRLSACAGSQRDVFDFQIVEVQTALQEEIQKAGGQPGPAAIAA